MRFLYRKTLFKMFLTRTFLFVNRFLKFLLHILRQTRCLIVPRKYFFYIWTVVKYLQKPIITHYETDFSNTIREAKTKALISCAVTAQLNCVCFRTDKMWFSHNAAHIKYKSFFGSNGNCQKGIGLYLTKPLSVALFSINHTTIITGVIQMMLPVMSSEYFVYHYNVMQKLAVVRVRRRSYHVSDDSKITSIIVYARTTAVLCI